MFRLVSACNLLCAPFCEEIVLVGSCRNRTSKLEIELKKYAKSMKVSIWTRITVWNSISGTFPVQQWSLRLL